MGDLEEIKELETDQKKLLQKVRKEVSIYQEEKIYKELKIINKRLMKLRNRN